MAIRRNRYHIQLKRTQLELNSTETPQDNTLQNYGLVFGEPVYLNNEKRLVIGPVLAEGTTSTKIPDCEAVKLVKQELEDPDDNSKTVELVEQGVFFKNRSSEDVVNLTDNTAHKIYPIVKMSSIQTDGEYELSELLINKVNIDKATLVSYPSLGIDDDGVFVDQFEPEQSDPSIPQSMVDIVNQKVSIDTESSATIDISLGRDLYGIYVRIPGESADELNYIKSYIDMLLGDALNIRLLALEGNIYYLQKMINNIGTIHVGSTPPANTNRLWIDTTTLTGGLKYCSNKSTNAWSHVPVAYT